MGRNLITNDCFQSCSETTWAAHTSSRHECPNSRPPCPRPRERHAVQRWYFTPGGGGGGGNSAGPRTPTSPPPPRGLRPTVSCQRYEPREPTGAKGAEWGYVATLPTCGPLLILLPALKRWRPPRWQGLCSHLAHSPPSPPPPPKGSHPPPKGPKGTVSWGGSWRPKPRGRPPPPPGYFTLSAYHG